MNDNDIENEFMRIERIIDQNYRIVQSMDMNIYALEKKFNELEKAICWFAFILTGTVIVAIAAFIGVII